MITTGRVQNGVVVLAEGVRLPEGQQVTVVSSSKSTPMDNDKGHSILDIPPVRLGKVLDDVDGDSDLLGEMLEERS